MDGPGCPRIGLFHQADSVGLRTVPGARHRLRSQETRSPFAEPRIAALSGGRFSHLWRGEPPLHHLEPSSMVRRAMTPLVDPLVADGQGLISLATHGVT